MKRRRTKGMSRLKGRLFAAIKENAESGARLRLAGRVQGAMSHERDVDRYMKTAERHGWGDAAFMAEQTGIKRGHGPKTPKRVWRF